MRTAQEIVEAVRKRKEACREEMLKQTAALFVELGETMMQVPPGELWHMSSLRDADDYLASLTSPAP